jgi:4-hydroxy-3-polyprenylbenzoate decarboxylase
MKSITLAITGASGAQYGLRLLQLLLASSFKVHLLVSEAAQQVINIETSHTLPAEQNKWVDYFSVLYESAPEQLQIYSKQQWTASVASGSNAPDAMVICPCSSGSLSAIAQGASNNLIERAADVMLKERKPLIVVHREMPLSTIHIENLLKLSQLGVTVMPASPGFYHQPQSVEDMVDFVVARILDHLDIEHQMFARWGS